MQLRSALIVLLAGALLPDAADAQLLEGTRWTAPAPPAPDSVRLRIAPRPSRFTIVSARSATSLVGMVAGALAGYELGHTYTPVNERDAWIMSDQEATGLLVGAVAGTAFGAALPSFNSPCPFSRRFWRGVGGAFAGVLPALVLGPFGPPIGAALLQGRC